MYVMTGLGGNKRLGLDGSTCEESTSFELGQRAKTSPLCLRQLVPPDLTDICVGIFKICLEETGTILLV